MNNIFISHNAVIYISRIRFTQSLIVIKCHFSFREPIVLRQPLEADSNEPITDQDNELLAKFKEYRYGPEKMTWDPNCYECKVRYRDPKAKDLVMYLHAWRYKV